MLFQNTQSGVVTYLYSFALNLLFAELSRSSTSCYTFRNIMQIITRNIGQSPTWLMTWQHQLQLPHIVSVGFSQLCLLIASAGNLAKLQVATHSERCCSHSHCCTPPVWVPIFVTMGPWQQGPVWKKTEWHSITGLTPNALFCAKIWDLC